MAPLAFSVFELDPEAGELRRQGRLVHLAPQPMRVLALLVARTGEIVTREELRLCLWGDETFVEFDKGLNFCIAAVRAALNDDARSPRFVETMPRRGYRFLADVRRRETRAAREPARAAHRGDRSRGMRWAAAALPLLLAQSPLTLRATTRTTAAPQAVDAYKRGMSEVAEGRDGRRRSIHAFREAVRLDPRFAEAYYQLANSYLELASARELPSAAALSEAASAAARAADLEPIAETKHLVGVLRLLRDWDWTGAEREIVEARRLEPSWDSGLVSYARLLSAKGDDQGALASIDRAEALSPACHFVLRDSALIRFRARRYEEALAKLERAAEFAARDAAGDPGWREEDAFLRIRIRAGQGDWAAAQHEALHFIARKGYAESVQRRFAANEPRTAMRRFFERSVENMRPLAEAGQIPPTRMACVYALLAEPDPAASWLERAAEERDPGLVYELRNPDYDAVRNDPRFVALRDRVFGAAHASAHAAGSLFLASLTFP